MEPSNSQDQPPEDSKSPPDMEASLRRWEKGRIAKADENGGLTPLTQELPAKGTWRQPRLLETPPSTPEPPAGDAAETELTALIAECRFFMREVAFQSARLACDVTDRVRFIQSAGEMAQIGARVGETLAKLRGAGNERVEERRQRIIVERVERGAARAHPGGGGEGS
jgi:hypothetical protein